MQCTTKRRREKRQKKKLKKNLRHFSFSFSFCFYSRASLINHLIMLEDSYAQSNWTNQDMCRCHSAIALDGYKQNDSKQNDLNAFGVFKIECSNCSTIASVQSHFHSIFFAAIYAGGLCHWTCFKSLHNMCSPDSKYCVMEKPVDELMNESTAAKDKHERTAMWCALIRNWCEAIRS